MQAIHSRDIPVTISGTTDAGGRGAGRDVSPRTGADRTARRMGAILRAGLLALAVGLAMAGAPTESRAKVIWTGDWECPDLPGYADACKSVQQACESWWNNLDPGPTEIKNHTNNPDGSVYSKGCWIDPDGIIGAQTYLVWQVCYETKKRITTWKEFTDCGGVREKKSCDRTTSGVGNPCNAATGNKYESVTDFATAGPDVLAFRRNYNSRDNDIGIGATFRGKWRGTYDRSIYFPSNGVDGFLNRDDGNAFHFVNSGGVWAPALNNGDVEYALVADGANWTVTTPDGTVETYNASGVLQTIVTPRGYTQTLTYDGSGLLSTVTDNHGRQLGFAYNTVRRLTTLTLPGGKTIQYGWDSTYRRKLQTVTYPDNSTLTYHYDDADWAEHLTGITDGNGNRYATWTYDADGRAISSTHAGGVDQVTLVHDEVNSKTTVTNALGKQKVYHYATVQDARRITQIEDLAGATTPAASEVITYDANGYRASLTDREGNLTTYVRNARGLETSRTEASGTPLARTITTVWHPTLPLPTQIVRPNRTTDFTYDPDGNMLTRTETDTTSHTVPYVTTGQTRVWTYTYTAAGQRASVDGPLAGTGDTTTYTYDANGYLATTTNPLGHVTEVLTVDDWGLPTSIRDANNVVTDLAYDGRGRLISRTVNPGANQAVTTFAYDLAGQMVKITRPDGSVLNYAYDNAHRLTEVSNDLGEKIVYTRDLMGNVTKEEIKSASAAIKKVQTRVFDELGRMLESIGAGLQTTSFTYTKNDDLDTTTDPKSNVTDNAYDALNRLITVTDALTNTVGQDYDAAGNLIGVTDQRTLTTAYVHNGFGEVIRRTSPDTGITDYVYDAAGNVTQKTDARSVVTQYTYDAASRLKTKVFPASTAENVTYTYDDIAGGNFGVGRLTRIQDATGSTDYVYGARGNMLSETRTIAGQVYVTAYAYDAADNLIAMTYPSGRTVTYLRDSLGRVIYVTTRKSPTDPEHFLAAGIEYLPFGPIASMIFGNGQQAVFTYDQDYRLTDIDTTDGTTPAQDLAYGYDLASNIASITDNLDLPRNQTFLYDALHRLTDATGLYGDIDYTYDGVGNRLTRATTVAAVTTTETSSYAASSNRLLSVINGTTRTVGYTPNGNITTDSRGAGYEYLYNDANRMDEVREASVTTALYGVNDQGQRVVKTQGGTVTHFHFDRNGALIAESDGAGVLQREYVSLAGLPIAVIDAGKPVAPAEQVIDNDSAGASSTGTWTAGTDGALQQGADYAYSAGGTGTGAFTWTPTITTAGPQRVYARWPSAKLGSTATYTIHHAHGSDTVTVDQRENAGEWVLLGVYQMQPGMGHRVELSDVAGTSSVPQAAINIDNTHPDAVAIGSWTSFGWGTTPTMWGPNHLVASGGAGANVFQWPASAVSETARFQVYARWITEAGRATNAKYTIHTAGGPVVVTVDQTVNSGKWNSLGVFDLVAGAGPVVSLSDDANGSVSADGIAIRLWANDPGAGSASIWDNTNTAAVTLAGGWWTATYAGGGQFWGSNYRGAVTDPGKIVTFNLQVPSAGRYWLFTRCVRISRHGTVRYDVYHDGGRSDVYIDQLNYGGEWQMLGTYNLTPGMGHRVFLDANSQPSTEVCADAMAAVPDLNGPRRVVADAVKFVPNTAEAALSVHADHLGSPQKMTDGTGAVVWDAAYKPFGEEAAISGTATNNQRFPGQYFDAETGLHYNWFRDYDPSIGRYVQSDPIGLRGGVNTYGYVLGNPLTSIDLFGKAPRLPGMSLECVRLRLLVQITCKGFARRCKGGGIDDCPTLYAKRQLALDCANYQTLLTQRCYPDKPSHEDVVTAALNRAERCRRIIETECLACPAN